jgi:ABC-2 type transport system permease protein
MTGALISKLLRDLRVPLIVVALLLGGFQCLWAKITQRITEEILPQITRSIPLDVLLNMLFQGPGQLIQTLIGGESVNLAQTLDVLSIGYVHPLTLAILCIWAIGRAAGALTGEIDRGTMELLLAQPVARSRVIWAHLLIDVFTIAVLCLGLWGGNWLGIGLFGRIAAGAPRHIQVLRVDPCILFPALANVAALLFAVSGYTTWLSARGRFRGKVLGAAVLVTLLQFLVNVVGQLWDAAAFLRPFTVFYYYQPQQIILDHRWSVDLGKLWHMSQPLTVSGISVLASVGILGYGLALLTFCRRDLPAPL